MFLGLDWIGLVCTVANECDCCFVFLVPPFEVDEIVA